MCSTEPGERPEPRRISSVYMEANWTYHAYSMAPDGKTTIVYLPNGLEIHREGRPTLEERAAFQVQTLETLKTIEERASQLQAELAEKIVIPAADPAFAAFEADYVPRLRSVSDDLKTLEKTRVVWLDSSTYPPADARPTVTELQWIQYQLDNYGSVKEMLEAEIEPVN